MTDAIKTSGWQKRHSLVMASFLAMFIAYLDRVNISVAAIAMRIIGLVRDRKRPRVVLFFHRVYGDADRGGGTGRQVRRQTRHAVVVGGMVGLYGADTHRGLCLLCDADFGKDRIRSGRSAPESRGTEPLRTLDPGK